MGRKNCFTSWEITRDAFLSALLFLSQTALSWLPNVELVSLLLVLYTLVFKKHVWLILYVFIALEGLFYGFGLWWFSYLYVWAILCGSIRLLYHKRAPGPLGISLLSGTFGMLFGLLCSFSMLPVGGPKAALAWWVSGIPFDLFHGISNFLLTMVLFQPLYRIFLSLKQKSSLK